MNWIYLIISFLKRLSLTVLDPVIAKHAIYAQKRSMMNYNMKSSPWENPSHISSSPTTASMSAAELLLIVSSFQTLFLKNKYVCAALNRLQCVLLVISLRGECVKIFTWGRIEVTFSCTERMKGSGISFSSPFSPDEKENSCVIDWEEEKETFIIYTKKRFD